MGCQRMIRYFVILVSLIIFCYQLIQALCRLMSNDVVDLTEDVPISDLDSPPVITVCPRQPVNEQQLRYWGYISGVGFLMRGNYIFCE